MRNVYKVWFGVLWQGEEANWLRTWLCYFLLVVISVKVHVASLRIRSVGRGQLQSVDNCQGL